MEYSITVGIVVVLITCVYYQSDAAVLRGEVAGSLTQGQKAFLGVVQGKSRVKRAYVEGNRYGLSNEDINKILSVHLENRRDVNPTAANMKYITWDAELAATAQAHACTCNTYHDTSEERIEGTSWANAGQNIWGGTNWNVNNQPGNAVQGWFNEVSDYTYADRSCSDMCGHYTQGVWANSYKVGCGLAQCAELIGFDNRAGFLLVCNYGPAGNYQGASPYEQGASCSNCADEGFTGECQLNQCTPDTPCHGDTCVNGGTMNTTSCVCHDCNEGFTGHLCQQSMSDWEMTCYEEGTGGGDGGDDGGDGGDGGDDSGDGGDDSGDGGDGDGGAAAAAFSSGLLVTALLAPWIYI